jgi:two-component system response regulator (stage 0 sporulation protein F)
MAEGRRRAGDDHLSVLVIDDDVAAAETVVAYLRRGGLTAQAESNGFAGVNTAKRLRPHIVLLDVQMPGLDGLETARLIKRAVPATRIILVSGHPASLVEANRDSTVAFAVLEKPLPLPAILDFVRRALG